MKPGKAGDEAGFTYVAALIAVAAIGAGLAATGALWSRASQREKERELLWIGEQFRQAIGLYYQRTPGAIKRYPERLEDLLEDRRYLTAQRYLRKIYREPVTGRPEWGLIAAPEGGIMGVHSPSDERPLKSGQFPPRYSSFSGARTYSAWRFVYEPPGIIPRETLRASR